MLGQQQSGHQQAGRGQDRAKSRTTTVTREEQCGEHAAADRHPASDEG
jgi:hypothetical protein